MTDSVTSSPVHEIYGVDEILFFVPDVQRAKPWYIDLLRTQPIFDDPNYVALRVGTTIVGIHLADGKDSTGVAGQVAYWRVRDMDASIHHFETHGCQRYRGPIVGVDGVCVCQLKDPFGNAWGLVQKLDASGRR